MVKDLYTEGYLVKFNEGDTALLRKAIILNESIDDSLHTVIEGDSLNSIAFNYYNNSKLWYVIADVNNIQNPFELVIGQSLIIPTHSKLNNVRQ